jgi:hypothetical protein
MADILKTSAKTSQLAQALHASQKMSGKRVRDKPTDGAERGEIKQVPK